MSQPLGIKFETAVRILAEYMPHSEEKSRKPILFHDIRVGVYLYERGYSDDVILAGILHDAIEWSPVNILLLREEFGDTVVRLILANTKDRTIRDKNEITRELIQRCIQNGQDALIVKTADIIDSFTWYTVQNNSDQLIYCMRHANAIFRFKPEDFKDAIFNELRLWQRRYAHIVD